MEDIKNLIKNSMYAHKEMKDDLKNCAETRWLEKKVLKEFTLYSGDTLDNVVLPKVGVVSLDNQFFYTNNSSLKITVNTNVENIIPRPSCALRITFDKLDLREYNRVSTWIYIKSEGFQNFYFHFSLGNKGKEELHAPSLIPNTWNHVVWEINNIERDCVEQITINPVLLGCPPEALEEIEVYVDNVTLEQVAPEYELGWMLQDRIAYSHCGFFKDSTKVAITQKKEDDYFYILDSSDKIIYKGKVEETETSIGKFYKLDFSSVKECGKYYLKIDNRRTNEFLIDENPYLSSIWKSINFLRSLRCGEDVEGVHSACHLNCRTKNDKGQSVPNFGGWHDAGDVSQFEICTAEMAQAILELAEVIGKKDVVLSDRLLEEAKVGISWLLRTRFNDGTRVLGVTYSIWRNNLLDENNQTVYQGSCEDSPFENFCASAAEAVAARMFENVDEAFSLWAKRCAIADFEFARNGYLNNKYSKRWGPNIVSQTSGDGLLAACELYQLTKDEKYLEYARSYANDVLDCQETEYIDSKKTIRGFFYEDKNHQYILSYEHRGHEQTPIHGLARLCEIAPNDKEYPKWLKGLELYSEYIKITADAVKPYYLIPGGIYDVNKINIKHFTVHKNYATEEVALEELKSQVKAGIKITDDIYLRKMPIAVTRRGFHAVLLSKTKAISMIARVLNDNKLKEIAIKQLEWILGNNPFASSTMYGEGNNYHPLYVAFSRQMVGALPVGIKTFKEKDEPYWPVINNAVYKEIWGHTTGKYLWVLADLL